ncbi:hypothetical protein [Salipaludibacillus neizhouensis]|uniref:hypothetical protein n=1 Tax=Salipaludibacillus neizhouensis TaxID=885475 RepID=UPI0011C3D0A3|nr:hypothetical protein [Salipaludibacillus neizhouensis]
MTKVYSTINGLKRMSTLECLRRIALQQSLNFPDEETLFLIILVKNDLLLYILSASSLIIININME